MLSMNSHFALARRSFVVSTIVTIAAFAISLVILGVLFVSASTEARTALVDSTYPRDILGLPILEGFHRSGKFGVHMFPGALVFLVVPVVVGLVASIPGVRRFARARD